MGSSRSSTLGRHHLVGSAVILAAILLTLIIGFWYPLSSRSLGYLPTCGTQDIHSTHRYQFLFGGLTDKAAYNQIKIATNPTLAQLCARNTKAVRDYQTAKLYLW